MRKIWKVVLLFFCLFICSCSTKIEKFRLDDEYYTSENKGLQVVNSYDVILENENNEKSFAVYVYLSGCTSCAAFKPILTEYLENNNLMFYSISIDEVNKSENQLNNKIDYAPSVALFNKGKIVVYLDAESDKHIQYYKTIDGFNKWFTTYIEL